MLERLIDVYTTTEAFYIQVFGDLLFLSAVCEEIITDRNYIGVNEI